MSTFKLGDVVRVIRPTETDNPRYNIQLNEEFIVTAVTKSGELVGVEGKNNNRAQYYADRFVKVNAKHVEGVQPSNTWLDRPKPKSKVLNTWSGGNDDITLGKTYLVDADGNFDDDAGDLRLARHGTWILESEAKTPFIDDIEASRVLVKWHGIKTDITLGKVYKLAAATGDFEDDDGDIRNIDLGEWEDIKYPPKVKIKLKNPPVSVDSGANGSYYKIVILSKQTADKRPDYKVECNDLIEALQMNFAEANAFKAVWRKSAARQGRGKSGNDPLYDAQKIYWAGQRLVAQES